jgi:predicted molibdopterin-dependent oxidoreductase YjgC
MARVDADAMGVVEGELVEVRSRRGHVVVPARLGGMEPGVVFIPFHYGDEGDESGELPTTANRLTMSGWDPVSKQPHFKFAAVSIRPVSPAGDRDGGPPAADLAGRPRPDQQAIAERRVARRREREAAGTGRGKR